ncbi:MAG: nitronate monooxygenase [Proteobacteria bacterium]|nr:nitronate monooxygenase [Pseudomonadota bacterium]
MKWDNRLTELLGCKYPIMQGALTGVGTWEFAAACSNAGADGCITAAVYKTPEKLREAIKQIRTVTSHFTVNVSIGACPNIDGMFDVCFEEQIPVLETAIYRPDEYVDRIKQSGVKWIHKGATVGFCKHAEDMGADAVVLIGIEGFGIKNIRQIPTFTSLCWARDQIGVPLLIGGGIGNGRTMAAALAAGADGVYIGSAIMATHECPISERVKQNMILAQPDEPYRIRELIAPPDPEAYAELMAKRDSMDLNKWIRLVEATFLKLKDKKKSKGEKTIWEEGAEGLGEDPFAEGSTKGPFSFACAYINQIVSVQTFIDNMVKEAEDLFQTFARRHQLTS